jgi:xylulokinase
LLEGCAFAMRDVADRLKELGADIRSLLLLGGGARSTLWAQIRADVLGLPTEISARVDSSPVGAAMLAAVAAGAIDHLQRAAELVREPAAQLAPSAATRGAYGEAYGRYRRLFDNLRPMFEPARPAAVRPNGNRVGREASIH